MIELKKINIKTLYYYTYQRKQSTEYIYNR